jgi:IS30 family transposase
MKVARMGRLKRTGLSAEQKKEVRHRWRQGQTLSEIGKVFGKHTGSIHGVVSLRGGISPVSRIRSARALTDGEREEISRGLMASLSMREIARRLNRSCSTISREIARNGGSVGYRAMLAESRAWDRAKRPKTCLLASRTGLQHEVARKLQDDWSPEQISGWLKETYRDDKSMQVSHETIYRSLFFQARGVLKKELVAHLRSRRMMRHAKNATIKGQPRGQIIDAVSIRERGPEAEDRAIPGHWEGDLISGSNNSHIATLVERHSRFVLLVRVKGKDTHSVVSALTRQVRRLPPGMMSTLTWDRGMELARRKAFTVATDVKVYFCDPRSPWQRGSNENTNGLLRQYYPKGTDLSGFTQRQLDATALKLNTRPRKTLGFATPGDKLAASVALTG